MGKMLIVMPSVNTDCASDHKVLYRPKAAHLDG